jgi:hypothetical protein
MRRPLVAIGVLSCFGLVACEDGPTQTYTPEPPGAANLINDGQTPPAVNNATAPFTVASSGTNLQVICNAQKLQTTWAKMVQQPIVPPTKVADLDMAGLAADGVTETWNGITIEQAEQINCQSTNIGDWFGDGNQDNYWGDGAEVVAQYLVSNHLIVEITLQLGYTGSMDFTSRDGMHKYSIPLGTPITKDGNPYPTIDWYEQQYGLGQSPTFKAQINELYDALIATFAPGLPQEADCQAAGTCVAGNFGQVAYIYISALGIGFEVASYSAGPPTTNTVVQYQIYGAKILPYSLAAPVFKLDAQGVITQPQVLPGDSATTACQLQMGLHWSTFLANCVNTGGPNGVEYNKEIGALSHDDETWTFNVQGVDLNYRDGTLGPTAVVLDNTVPSPTDISVNFSVDQSALGPLANDWQGDDTSSATALEDLHGSGMVYLQYAQNVQSALNAYNTAKGLPTHALGAPECTTGVNPDTLNFAKGCTGFEGFITTAPSKYGTTPTNFPANALGTIDPTFGIPQALAVEPGLGLGLKCGHPVAAFCLDANGIVNIGAQGVPTTANGGGYTLCAPPQGGSGNLFVESFNRVLQVWAGGNQAALPPDVSDVRFFWKQYVLAMIAYMEVAKADGSETETAVSSTTVDLDSLFFDSQGDGQFEIGEYVDRRFASTTQPPTDVRLEADVKNGIMDLYTFSRELYRGETAIYSAMLENPADGVGQENTALLSNVFGSPVLTAPPVGRAGWSASSDGTLTAYQCATATTPADLKTCGDQLVPLDSNGNPLLKPYQGAFLNTAFSLGQTPIKVTQTFSETQQATVSIPLYSWPYGWGLDPQGAVAYNGTGTPLAPLSILIPWTPQQSGVGFGIPLTGTLWQFIETGNLDFSGTTISASVDYTPVIDPNTMLPMTDGTIQFNAVETTDFLGLVFVCQDQTTGDLLTARMYDTVAGIQNWFAAHPGAYDNCGMITTYSPYDNYADYITSLTNGVELDITQGGGYGRVVDVVLFVPGQGEAQ